MFLILACNSKKDSTLSEKKQLDTTNISSKVQKENSSIKDLKSRLECDYLDEEPPGTTPKLFAPNLVSTKVEHSAVMFTPNGNELWFGRMYPAKIWFMKKTDGKWGKPQLSHLPKGYGELYPYLTSDGNKLFFMSDMPIHEDGNKLRRSDGEIWFIERDGKNWSEPKHLGDNINVGNRQAVGSISSDGTLYFSASITDGNKKSTDIYKSEMVNGVYQKADYIPELNSAQPEFSPCVAPDESFIIISSFRGGYGLSDLFISFRKKDGSWGTLKNLGSKINSKYKDEFPYISPDGKYLFFNSNRPSELNSKRIPDGPGNMYWVSIDFISKNFIK